MTKLMEAIIQVWHPGLRVGGKMSDSNSDLSKIFDALTQSEWSLAAKNFVATNTQWKSWYTARILCFNKSFIRNRTNSTGIPNLGVWCKSDPKWTSGVGIGQKIRLRPLVLLGIGLHQKASDYLPLRNPELASRQ